MNTKYKSFYFKDDDFIYIELVNGIEVTKSIPIFINGLNINPKVLSIADMVNKSKKELKEGEYHPHLDFYNSLKNPLDSYETLSILVNSYANDIKGGSMYYTLTHANTGKKQFKGKIVTSSRDIFYARLFNLWKSNILKLDEENRFKDIPISK